MSNTFWQIVNIFLEGDYITCGIYCYIDKKDNTIVYIGKDSNIDRCIRHKAHYASSRYDAQPINKILQQNPNRYTYQVLVWNVDSQERLDALEIQYIRQLKPKFNFTDGGGGVTGFRHSNMTKEYLSMKAKARWKNPNSKYNTEEYKEKMRRVSTGRTHSEKTRKKLRDIQKDKPKTESHKKNLSKSKTKTGFLGVYIMDCPSCNQGYRWGYDCINDGNRIVMSSTDLLKLKNKIQAQNLRWAIVDDEKAKKSLRLNKND